MILAPLSDAARHLGLHPGLGAAFAWLRDQASSASEETYPVAEGVKAIVQTYQTAPAADKKWETHRRHVDLQVVLAGRELVGWHPAGSLVTRVPYDAGKDAEFYEPPAAPAARFRLEEGLFALFFPEDGHQPGVQDETPGHVRKVVFKLAV